MSLSIVIGSLKRTKESLRFQEGHETIWFTKSSDFQKLIELNSVIRR